MIGAGGFGSIQGACIAGICLGLMETMSSLIIGPTYRDLTVFVAFIIILVVRQIILLRRRQFFAGLILIFWGTDNMFDLTTTYKKRRAALLGVFMLVSIFWAALSDSPPPL